MRRNAIWVFPLVSLALHAYLAARLLPAWNLGGWGTGAALAAAFASALTIPATLILQLRRMPVLLANALAWAGYFAMGLFSSLLVLTLLRDLLLVPLSLWNFLRPGALDLQSYSQASAQAVAALSGAISLVGLFNARRLARVVEVDLPIPGLPAALSGFTIVQLSDIHVGPTIRRAYLERIVRRANGLDADLVAITGDVIDGSVDQLREQVAPLADLRAKHGVYCVTGNHEYYHGADAWVSEWQRLGLQVLLNTNAVLEHRGQRLLVGGIADYSAHQFIASHRSDAAAAARTSEPVALKLLLAHQPRSAEAAAAAGFDLQLSGHTHGGQFMPWPFFVPLQQPVVAGLMRLKQLLVYTSRGTGYWGPPLRFFAPSEITRLRLVGA